MENENTQENKVILPALFRLALLVVPLAAAIFFFWVNPLLCSILCVGILLTWLCVDAGPFRARPVEAKEKPLFERMQAAAKPSALAGTAMKLVIFVALIQSRLMV